MEVAQQVSAGVANLSINIGQLPQDAGADRHISGVVNGADPQTQNVRAVGGILFLVLATLDDHHRINDVAEGFAHLPPLLIQGKTMGQDPFVRSMAIDGHGGEQRALEPAAVLVRPFEIQISRVAEVLALTGDGCPA